MKSKYLRNETKLVEINNQIKDITINDINSLIKLKRSLDGFKNQIEGGKNNFLNNQNYILDKSLKKRYFLGKLYPINEYEKEYIKKLQIGFLIFLITHFLYFILATGFIFYIIGIISVVVFSIYIYYKYITMYFFFSKRRNSIYTLIKDNPNGVITHKKRK